MLHDAHRCTLILAIKYSFHMFKVVCKLHTKCTYNFRMRNSFTHTHTHTHTYNTHSVFNLIFSFLSGVSAKKI